MAIKAYRDIEAGEEITVSCNLPPLPSCSCANTT